MSATPVTFIADFAPERSRLTTLLRLFMAIPHVVVLIFYGIAVFFAIVIGWFALVFTGRWPQGLYDFTAGFFRWNARANAYLFLATDAYPPFDGDEHPEYPVRLAIGPPKDGYDRVKVLARIFLIIPVYIVAYVLSIVAQLVALVSWFVIIVTGRQVEGLHSALAFSLGYEMKAYAFMGLVFEEWPSFSDEPAQVGGSPATPTITESAPAGWEAPEAPQAPRD